MTALPCTQPERLTSGSLDARQNTLVVLLEEFETSSFILRFADWTYDDNRRQVVTAVCVKLTLAMWLQSIDWLVISHDSSVSFQTRKNIVVFDKACNLESKICVIASSRLVGKSTFFEPMSSSACV